ncbi:MAG: hypothetical protein P8Y05_15020 [Deinococcales bacterium]
MRATEFFETHPVFRHEEFLAAHTADGRSSVTSNNLLAQHVASGRLLRVRKGLYATVRKGQDPRSAMVDPYLLATRLTRDAAVAYHAAMQFHGRAYSMWRRFHFLTAQRTRPFTFRGMEFVPVRAPARVRGQPQLGGGIRSSEVESKRSITAVGRRASPRSSEPSSIFSMRRTRVEAGRRSGAHWKWSSTSTLKRSPIMLWHSGQR